MFWMLRRDRLREETAHLDYHGTFQRFIVRAATEAEARQKAAAWDAGDQAHIWEDPELTRAVRLEPDGEPGVLMAERKWGG